MGHEEDEKAFQDCCWRNLRFWGDSVRNREFERRTGLLCVILTESHTFLEKCPYNMNVLCQFLHISNVRTGSCNLLSHTKVLMHTHTGTHSCAYFGVILV